MNCLENKPLEFKCYAPSFPRRREPRESPGVRKHWLPVFTGMTTVTRESDNRRFTTGFLVFFTQPKRQDCDRRTPGLTGQGTQFSGYNHLVHQLLARISYFELLPVEKKDVQFVLVAPHTGSLAGVVNTILEQGFDLQNIRLCLNRKARDANISFSAF